MRYYLSNFCIIIKTLTKSLVYKGTSEEIKISEPPQLFFNTQWNTQSSISIKKYLRQMKNILPLSNILRNTTTHQIQYVTDLRNCLLFSYCNCCYKGWTLMCKHLIQESNEKNLLLEDELQSLLNSYIATKFLRLVTVFR